ncbi:MAG TPA: hypothetical protein VFW98_17965 [Gemmatimonadaceae bacterium]|nr:hypothetical protein [Gemmatimonadaceae bacterium]
MTEQAIWDVWATAVAREEVLRGAEDDWPILRKVAAHVCAERLRVCRHEQPMDGRLLDAIAATSAAERRPRSDEVRGWVADALAALPEKQRVAVDFRFRWHFPYWAVAAGIDAPESTARVCVLRGLQKLRRYAAAHPPPRDPDD